MKKFIATALLPLLLALSACGSTDTGDGNGVDEDGIPNLEQVVGRIIVEGESDVFVRKFTIDGTECVITTYEESITCNWNTQTNTPTPEEFDNEFE